MTTAQTHLNDWQNEVLGRLRVLGGVMYERAFLGRGRNAVSLLAPVSVPDCRIALLLIPASLAAHYELLHKDLGKKYVVSSAVFPSGMGHLVKNDDGSAGGTPFLHVISRARLSMFGSDKLLDQLAPDLIICDEEHERTVRGSRLSKYIAKARPRALIWTKDGGGRGAP